MIRSMTGFGKVSRQFPDQHLTVEIRTLNSKQQDVSVRMPAAFREKELDIRKLLVEKLTRGKIDCQIKGEDLKGETIPGVNKTAFQHYLTELRSIAKELDIRNTEALIPSVLRWPEILTESNHEITPTEWEEIIGVVSEAADAVDQYRRDEGAAIAKDLKKQVKAILSMMTEIPPFEKDRIVIIRDRLTQHLEEWRQTTENEKDRLGQEVFYYMEKLDITEEKIRLEHHCNYFLQTMNTKGVHGKKLGFISQEIGREINTLGSKAYHAELQKIVIRMKDTLEKIKEQVLNVL